MIMDMALSGNPDATFAEMRAMLREARVEARGRRPFSCRQAAQKVWLAATTAADAMAGPQTSRQGVIDAFRRAWGSRGQIVAETLNAALHVGVHYSGAACSPELIDAHVAAVANEKTVRDPRMRLRLSRRAR